MAEYKLYKYKVWSKCDDGFKFGSFENDRLQFMKIIVEITGSQQNSRKKYMYKIAINMIVF